MATRIQTLIGIYQITDISSEDAFGMEQKDRDRLIGAYFTFAPNSKFYIRKNDKYKPNDWIGCYNAVKLILHPDHPLYNIMGEYLYTFHEFKFKKVI